MQREYTVSVLTPTHETPVPLLLRAFRSLQNQRFGFERIQWVVVLHNCGTSYKAEVRQLLSAYENITLKEADRPGTGVSWARNQTLSAARGEWLFFLDADDEMKSDCVGTVLEAMNQYRADIGIYEAERSVNGTLAAYYIDSPDDETRVFDRGDPRIGKILCSCGLVLWTRCYRRAFLQKQALRFDESLTYGEDYAFNLAATAGANRIMTFPGLIGYRYYSKTGMTKEPIESYCIETAVSCAHYLANLYEDAVRLGLAVDNLIWFQLFEIVVNPCLKVSEPERRTLSDAIVPLLRQLSLPEMLRKDLQPRANFIRKRILRFIGRPLLNIRERVILGDIYTYDDRYGVPIFLGATFPEKINRDVLSKALEATARRFPVVNRYIIKVGVGYYLADRDKPIKLEEDASPCAFRVMVEGTQMITACNHALMDGAALLRITEYLANCYGKLMNSSSGISSVRPKPLNAAADSPEIKTEAALDGFDPLEVEISPGTSFLPGNNIKSAIKLPYPENWTSEMRIIHTPTRPVLKLCKELQTSPSILFSLLIAEAIVRMFPESSTRPLVLYLPINFRECLGCKETIKNSSFAWIQDLNEDRFKKLDFSEKAAVLKSELDRLKKDRRVAEGWISFFKGMNSYSLRHNMDGIHKTIHSAPWTFMLSYLRVHDEDRLQVKDWFFGGDNWPQDFRMLEYGGCFHLLIRPLEVEGFDDIIMEVLKEHGLLCRGGRWMNPKLSFFVPSLKKNLKTAFFLPGSSEKDVKTLLPCVKEAVGQGYYVRVYSASEYRKPIEEAGAVCIDFCQYKKQPDLADDMLAQDRLVWQPSVVVSIQGDTVKLLSKGHLSEEGFLQRAQVLPCAKTWYRNVSGLSRDAVGRLVGGFQNWMRQDRTLWNIACFLMPDGNTQVFLQPPEKLDSSELHKGIAGFIDRAHFSA